MSEIAGTPKRERLKAIMIGSAITAFIVCFLFYNAIVSITDGLDFIWILMLATLTGITYGCAFFIGVRLFENTLEQYIVSDEFSERNQWIDLKTETRSSGDKAIDGWVKHYVFARTALAIGILPLIASVLLFFVF